MNSNNYITFIFKINYETRIGEDIYIIGDHPDFGNWETPKFKLIWNDNHIWQAEYKFLTSLKFIEFKFVCCSQTSIKWEKGENRLLSSNNLKGLEKTSDGKYILNCIWNHFSLTFNIHYKIIDPNSEMRIVGSLEALSNWEGDNDKSVIMKWNKNMELIGKDGNPNKGFWTVTVLIKNEKKNYIFDYRYIIFDNKTKTSIWERDPNRHLELTINKNNVVKNIIDNNSKLLLTNSFLEIIDINFVGKLLFDKIGDKNIFIGPYPQSEEDFKKISEKGINEIINLQTDNDMKDRQINIELLKTKAKKYGININRYPIEDYCHNVMVSRLKGASDLLDVILKKGHIVYVHCTAGMYRASSTVILYLILHQKFKVEEAIQYCAKYRPIICPNVKAIYELTEIYKPNLIEKNTNNIPEKKIIKKVKKK